MADKTCDYCGSAGKMPTFMDGETMCYQCIDVLPISAKDARKQLHDLRIAVVKAFGVTPVGCDGALLVKFDDYNRILNILNT